MPKLTYKNDPDCGLIEFFVDGELLTEWVYEDDPEASFNEFKKIYEYGFKAGCEAGKFIEKN